MTKRSRRIEDIRVSKDMVEFRGKAKRRLEEDAKAYYRATGEKVSPQQMGELALEHIQILNRFFNLLPEHMRGKPIPAPLLYTFRLQAGMVWHVKRYVEACRMAGLTPKASA